MNITVAEIATHPPLTTEFYLRMLWEYLLFFNNIWFVRHVVGVIPGSDLSCRRDIVFVFVFEIHNIVLWIAYL
jgi:hypothetical protein